MKAENEINNEINSDFRSSGSGEARKYLKNYAFPSTCRLEEPIFQLKFSKVYFCLVSGLEYAFVFFYASFGKNRVRQ